MSLELYHNIRIFIARISLISSTVVAAELKIEIPMDSRGKARVRIY